MNRVVGCSGPERGWTFGTTRWKQSELPCGLLARARGELTCRYPIYHLLTEHFLPLLAKGEPEASEHLSPSSSNQKATDTLHHVLFTSHHLIAPSKRKDLKGLSSSLNLKGFGKIGHPGIIFAEGSHADLEEFVKEVKSWQWLALRLRVFEEDTDGKPRGTGRGEWTELEKLGEAVEWLRSVGKERLLLEIGMGSGANTR